MIVKEKTLIFAPYFSLGMETITLRYDPDSEFAKALESLIQNSKEVSVYGRVWVVCGPYVYGNLFGTIGEQKVVIPDGFFKAVLRQEGNSYRSIAFVFENNANTQHLKKAVVSVNDVEALIGYDLFTNLDNRIEEMVESQSDFDNWKK